MLAAIKMATWSLARELGRIHEIEKLKKIAFLENIEQFNPKDSEMTWYLEQNKMQRKK